MKRSYQKREKRIHAAPSVARHLLLAWLTAALGELLLMPAGLNAVKGLEGLAAMSLLRLGVVTAVVFVLLEVLQRWLRLPAQRCAMIVTVTVLAAITVPAARSALYLVACLLILLMMLVYALRGWNADAEAAPCAKGSLAAVSLTAVLALMFFLLVSAWTVGRIYSFCTPSFDFAIFAQMFHSMGTTGMPITTIERDGALSHFAVHVSPIYYLLLPFYMLVPAPATLQVLQAAVMASAVIPLYLIAKQHGLPPFMRTSLCALLLLFPAFAGGAGYDIHENAFLTTLILWLFYFADRRKTLPAVIFALLTMMVKEDAPVYVAVIALWLLLKGLLHKNKWERMMGIGLLVSAVVYFLGVTSYLSARGDGVMTYRYSNFMYDGSGSLLTVIKAVLLSPMKAVYECMDPEKLEFILLTMLPLVGLPLLTRRYERLILLIPYILVNLMSDYQYQHDIFFQYVFGSTACLFYLVTVNLADLKDTKLRAAVLALALCISTVLFCQNILPEATRYPKNCKTYEAYYDSLREVLDTVPEGASVAASTYYTTYLSQRDVLYDVRYASQEHIFGCEYLVLGVGSTYSYKPYAVNGENGFENFRDLALSHGYEKTAEYEGKLEIYKKS